MFLKKYMSKKCKGNLFLLLGEAFNLLRNIWQATGSKHIVIPLCSALRKVAC